MEIISSIFIPTSDGLKRIEINEIIYLESDSNYTKINLLNSTEVVPRPLKVFEAQLNRNFFRIHHSFIINMNHLKAVIKGKPYRVKLEGNCIVPIADSKKDSFHEYLKRFAYIL